MLDTTIKITVLTDRRNTKRWSGGVIKTDRERGRRHKEKQTN